MTSLEHFEALVHGAMGRKGAGVERTHRTEDVVHFSVVSDAGAASACLWAREHIGGLVDFVVIDAAGAQVFWRHLEGPTAGELTACWNEMIATYDRLTPA